MTEKNLFANNDRIIAMNIDQLRKDALEHLWTHNGSWVDMAENGGPVIILKAKGIRLTDSDGVEWMDVSSGYQCVTAGHAREELAEAAIEQMREIAYFPNFGATPPTIKLSKKLAQITPGNLTRSFFVNGGSDAVETAVKMARAYHVRNKEGSRYRIISRKGSYHGALGITTHLGGRDVNEQRDYVPSFPGLLYAPQPNAYRSSFNTEDPELDAELCANAIQDLIEFHGPETVSAIVADPIPGANASVPGSCYWPMLREICNKYGVILIGDEVITAWGRTGKMFALEHWDVVPDIMTVAKGLSSAHLPVGAVIATKEIASVFAGGEVSKPFIHALTFGGHPVTNAVALRNIKLIEDENLVKNSETQGAYIKKRLLEMMDKYPMIGCVQGKGLQIGIDLVIDRVSKEPIPDSVRETLGDELEKRRLLVRPGSFGFTLYPPLIINREEVNELLEKMDESFSVTHKLFF